MGGQTPKARAGTLWKELGSPYPREHVGKLGPRRASLSASESGTVREQAPVWGLAFCVLRPVAAGSQEQLLLISCRFGLCAAAFAQVSGGGGSWGSLKNPRSIRVLFHLAHACSVSGWAPSSALHSPASKCER